MRASLVSSAIAGVVVGVGSSIAIVIAAAQAVGADAAQIASWVSAICLGTGVSSVVLSYRHRIPMITAWSTPGAALIGATAIGGIPAYSLEAAVGAFLLTAVLILLCATLRPIATAIARIPGPLAAAMLAGILIGFTIAVFDTAAEDPLLILPLLAVFLIVRLFSATWSVIAVLGAAVVWTGIRGRFSGFEGGLAVTEFVWVTPAFEVPALLGLGLPLFIVSMASQYLPGFAVLRAAGYEPPTRSAFAVTGLMSLLTAPFGAHTTTMAAITASLCTGPDAHPDPGKRWLAGVFYGIGFLVLAAIGVTVVAGFAALPASVIVTVAGLALVGPLMNALNAALTPEPTRLAAVLTLTATASGLSLFGIGAAFWGLVLGLAVFGLDRALFGRKRTAVKVPGGVTHHGQGDQQPDQPGQ